MQAYNKLIRDNIDDIINANGKGEQAITRTLTEEEYHVELLKKLEEEYNELLGAIKSGIIDDIIEESADLIEVIRAINSDNLEIVMQKLDDKRNKKGGFAKRKYLEYVQENKYDNKNR